MFSTISKLLTNHKAINWSMADQAMVSMVNFVTGIILARYLGLEEFGIFTLAWLVVLFAQGIQLALVVNPMMSIGPKQELYPAREYYEAIYTHELLFLLATFSLILFSACFVYIFFPDWEFGNTLFVLSFVTVAFLAQDFLRRYLYTCKEASLAFINDAICYLGQLALLLWCFNNVTMDSARTLLVVAVTSLVAVIFGIKFLPSIPRDKSRITKVMLRNWSFSRWLIASSFVQWTSGHIFTIAAGLWLGPAAVGAMKAAQNIMGVTHILFQGFENIVPVQAARKYAGAGMQAMEKYLKRVTLVGLVGTSIIAGVAGAAPAFWMGLVYGEEFEVYGNVLIWYVFIYPIVFVSVMLRIWLRSLEKTRSIFQSYVFMNIVGILSIFPLVEYFELNGVLAGVFITNIAMVVCLIAFLRSRSSEVSSLN